MKVFIFLISFMLIFSCREEKIFRTDNFELRQLESKETSDRVDRASYFLVYAKYQSKTEKEFNVRCFAKVNGTYRFLEIPIEKIRVRLTKDATSKPFIVIQYMGYEKRKENEIDLLIEYSEFNFSTVYEINCSEKYLPEKLMPIEI